MRNKVRQQDSEKRIENFSEVSLGFSDEQALQEAKRCLQCKKPKCVEGCPVNIDIPAFIKLIVENSREKSLSKIKEKNNLPAVCGRVCPQEDQCEKLCILSNKGNPINIGALERYAADYELNKSLKKQSKVLAKDDLERIAVVGSGPAGLTTAADLVRLGYRVTLFESLHVSGGVLVYGIPEFRLPKDIVSSEVEYIASLGVEIKTNFLVGKTCSLDDLFKDGFKAVFLGLGAGLPQFLGIVGENFSGVYSANEFLTRVNLMKAYLFPEYATPVDVGKKVVVIGGGNVALDCARAALRLHREVTLVYRRTEAQMPARLEEIENAKEEGFAFKLLTQPVEILANEKGRVRGLKCIKMELGEPDDSGRRRPLPIENSDFIIEADTVIEAIGQKPNPLVVKVTPDLKVNDSGTIKVDENYMTSIDGVFAGGDIITGADTVISAMGAGKKAAAAINSYIKKQRG